MPPVTVVTVQNLEKEKKKKKEKKRRRQSASPKLHCRWIVGSIVWTVAKYYNGIVAFYIVNRYMDQLLLNNWLLYLIFVTQIFLQQKKWVLFIFWGSFRFLA